MGPSMQQLEEMLPKILMRSRAQSTVKKYEGAICRWREWAESQDVSYFPAEPFHIALYLVKLLQQSVTAAPVSAAVCGIKWLHEVCGVVDPCSHPMVRNVHQAARRILAQKRRRKQPLTGALLQRLYGSLKCEMDSLKVLQFLTLVVVGYAGLLRWNDLSQIFADEVHCMENYAVIYQRGRKNDQFRHGSWIYISRWDGDLCPVTLLQKLLKQGCYKGHVKLFGRVKKKRKGRECIRGEMSYSRARELMREAMLQIGEDPAQYGLHSLRSGGATIAAAAGISDRLIQRQGGWRSEASMKCYVKESLQSLLKVSEALAV